jgi:hypothetical protein
MNLDILSHTRPVQGKVVHAPCKRYMSEMATPGTSPTYYSGDPDLDLARGVLRP